MVLQDEPDDAPADWEEVPLDVDLVNMPVNALEEKPGMLDLVDFIISLIDRQDRQYFLNLGNGFMRKLIVNPSVELQP